MEMKKINSMTFECVPVLRVIENSLKTMCTVRISTFLCAACDMTHLQITDSSIELTYSVSLSPIDAEALANNLINPAPVALEEIG